MNPNDPFDDNSRDWIDWSLSVIALTALLALAYLITTNIL